MGRQEAETLALEALGWLAGEEGLLDAFLGVAGLNRGDLGALAGEPETLAAVLDFLMTDDAWVLGFAGATGRAPGVVALARTALPGGDLPHWT